MILQVRGRWGNHIFFIQTTSFNSTDRLEKTKKCFLDSGKAIFCHQLSMTLHTSSSIRMTIHSDFALFLVRMEFPFIGRFRRKI